MIRIFILYAASGFVSLGYQVAWFRIFADWFGSTNLTFTLVVCNFIGGLGIGALLSARIADGFANRIHLKDPLRVYGITELCVGCTVLLTALVAYLPAPSLWGPFPYVLDDGIWVQTMGYRFAQVGLAAACVFIPCLFMGVTFPLLCKTFSGTVPQSGQVPAALYAWNTLGACSGVLACQFVLLPRLGYEPTLWLMAALNLLLGAYFVVTGGAPEASTETAVTPAMAPADAKEDVCRVMLLCAVLSGLLSGALEGDLFKRLSFVIELNPGATMSFISFWAILAIFMASAFVHRLAGLRLAHIKIAFVLALAYGAVTWMFVDDIMAFVATWFAGQPPGVSVETSGMIFPANLVQLLLITGIVVFAPYFLISSLLPYACNRLQAQGRHLGFAYGLNTLAFCVGLIGFTFVAPRVNIFYSLKLFMALFVLGTLLLMLISERRRMQAWQPALVTVLFVAACAFTPSAFDQSYFRPGTRPATSPISALKSNSAHTTFVAQGRGPGESSRLYFGRLSMSGTNAKMQSYMRLMAHFPLLAHPQPEKALLICFGVGNTASAIAAHESVVQINVVDLNEKVFETAPEFAETNLGVYGDPRVRFIHDDGRNFLNLTDEHYDLITSEPPPPMSTGVYRLYSREYYESVLNHLTPRGMMTQWLPVYQMPPEAVDLAIGTFLEVFRHTLLFTGFEQELILVGSASPIDLSLIEERFSASDAVTADLARIEIDNPLSLIARIMHSDAELREHYAGRRVISDQNNDLEHHFYQPWNETTIAYSPTRVLADLVAKLPEERDDLERALLHLGRLRYLVFGFPLEALAAIDASAEPGVAMADADWETISRLQRKTRRALEAGRRIEAISLLERSLWIAPEQVDALFRLASLRIAEGQFGAAISDLRRFQKLEAEDFNGYYLLGLALMRTGRSIDALAQFREAARLEPDRYQPINDMAFLLATHPDPQRRDPQEAIILAERASGLTGQRNPTVLTTLAAAYAADGQFDRAIQLARDTIAAFSGDPDADLAGITRHLRLYEEGRLAVDESLAPAARRDKLIRSR